MTDGEREIWNEMQRDAAPTWEEVEAELRAAGKCLECYGDGYVSQEWDFGNDKPIHDTCPACNGTT
jgi:excinuclease UvrABC ATPase subunit